MRAIATRTEKPAIRNTPVASVPTRVANRPNTMMNARMSNRFVVIALALPTRLFPSSRRYPRMAEVFRPAPSNFTLQAHSLDASFNLWRKSYHTGRSPCPQKPSHLDTFTSPITFTWQANRRFFSRLFSEEWGGTDKRAFSRQFMSDTSPSIVTAQVPQVPIPRQLITEADWL